MKNVMTRAWEIAKEAVVKFGGQVVEYLSGALKMAWAEIKKGADKMIQTAEEQYNSIYRVEDLTQEQLELILLDVEWAKKAGLGVDYEMESFSSYEAKELYRWRSEFNRFGKTIEEWFNDSIENSKQWVIKNEAREKAIQETVEKYEAVYAEFLSMEDGYFKVGDKMRKKFRDTNAEIKKMYTDKDQYKVEFNANRRAYKKMDSKWDEINGHKKPSRPTGKTITGPVYDDNAKPSYFN